MDDLGILMAIYEQSQFQQLIDQIDHQDFYQLVPNKYTVNGIPNIFHTTLCQGLTTNLSASEIIKYLKYIEEDTQKKYQKNNSETLLQRLFTEAPQVEKIHFFDREEYDILTLVMCSDILTLVNHQLRKICSQDFLNQHPIYYPHTTLAYLKKGKVEKYLELNIPDNFNWQIINLHYASELETNTFKITPELCFTESLQ
jgi:hypothetical protein